MNLIEEIANHIEFLGHGIMATSDQAGSVFWGLMPDDPDLCVAVFSSDSSYAGSPNGARIQIMTRAKTTREAYELSQQIAEDLTGFMGFLGGDRSYVSIDQTNASTGIGADAQRREIYSSNFIVKYCG